MAQLIACDIHPLNNQRVRAFLGDVLGADRESVGHWVRHWVAEGLWALESMVTGHPESGRFSHGDAPTLADICLVPQISSAERFACDLSAYPALMRIYEACMGLEAFDKAAPERQPDAE